jgi:hypothetical protein
MKRKSSLTGITNLDARREADQEILLINAQISL